MPISFIDPQPAQEPELEALEQWLGTPLSPSFRGLLTGMSNGGEVEPTGPSSAPSVGLVAVLGAERGDHLDIRTRLEALQGGGRLPAGFVPIADAEGGNLICLSTRPIDFGTVWFWDHELEVTGNSATLLASSFEAFMDDLAPMPDDAVLPTVTSVWVDPGLRTELEEGR